jgi:hypothetical protein
VAAFTALAIASLALSVYGQVKAGRAQKKAGEAAQSAANSEADLADFNAHVADLQATDAVERGGDAENRFRSHIRGVVGQQRAGFAAGNIDVGFGSAVDVQSDAAYLGELDALTIRTNAAREAWGYKVQGADLRARAEIARKTGVMQAAAGREAATASYIGAAGTLVGGTSSLLQQRYGFGASSSGRLPSRQRAPTSSTMPTGLSGM